MRPARVPPEKPRRTRARCRPSRDHPVRGRPRNRGSQRDKHEGGLVPALSNNRVGITYLTNAAPELAQEPQ